MGSVQCFAKVLVLYKTLLEASMSGFLNFLAMSAGQIVVTDHAEDTLQAVKGTSSLSKSWP